MNILNYWAISGTELRGTGLGTGLGMGNCFGPACFAADFGGNCFSIGPLYELSGLYT